ncbi:MAG: GxxExxY protein [Thermoplasmatota archaeon]
MQEARPLNVQASPADPDETSGSIVDAAVRIHRQVGGALLESHYARCLEHVLRKRGHEVAREVAFPLVFEDLRIDGAYRLDFLVDGCVVVEVKAVENLLPVHSAQLLTYLEITKAPIGLLLNFRVGLMKNGIHRFVGESYQPLRHEPRER